MNAAHKRRGRNTGPGALAQTVLLAGCGRGYRLDGGIMGGTCGAVHDRIDVGEYVVDVLAIAQLALPNLQPVKPIVALDIRIKLH